MTDNNPNEIRLAHARAVVDAASWRASVIDQKPVNGFTEKAVRCGNTLLRCTVHVGGRWETWAGEGMIGCGAEAAQAEARRCACEALAWLLATAQWDREARCIHYTAPAECPEVPPMSAHGLLFKAEMIRALLRERDPKSMTRRLVRHHRGSVTLVSRDPIEGRYWSEPWGWVRPPCASGDSVYAKETWAASFVLDNLSPRGIEAQGGEWVKRLWWRADGEALGFPATGRGCWRSPLFMPRWASRITRAVLAVRPERVQDITEDDARAEGIPTNGLGQYLPPYPSAAGYVHARDAFRERWDAINGVKSPWARNDYVWAITLGPVAPGGENV